MLQKTIAKIGKRLQQKIMSGAIRPQEIAREAEELMKEFSTNSSFVEMMESLKSAFGMEDMDMARAAGKESSARLATVRDRLRKKLEKRQAAQAAQASSSGKPSHPPPKNKK
jgi:type II secretory pathway component PulF